MPFFNSFPASTTLSPKNIPPISPNNFNYSISQGAYISAQMTNHSRSALPPRAVVPLGYSQVVIAERMAGIRYAAFSNLSTIPIAAQQISRANTLIATPLQHAETLSARFKSAYSTWLRTGRSSSKLFCLGEGAVKGGEGAIYLWAKLPDKYSDDFEVVRWLVHKHGVFVIPGR